MAPDRSVIRLSSAERLAESGQTDLEIAERVRGMGGRLSRSGILVINLRDAALKFEEQHRRIRTAISD